jgi:hypothetical protein
VNFHRRQRAEFASQFLSLERERLLGGLAPDEFRGEAGDGNGRLTAEGLERGAINDLPAVLFLEFDPQAQHLAAIRIADGADGVGPGQFTQVLRIGEGLLNPFLQIVIHFYPDRKNTINRAVPPDHGGPGHAETGALLRLSRRVNRIVRRHQSKMPRHRTHRGKSASQGHQRKPRDKSRRLAQSMQDFTDNPEIWHCNSFANSLMQLGERSMNDLVYSIADQNVETTKSIGIYNFSLHLAQYLSEHAQLQKLTVFSNDKVSPHLRLTAKAHVQEFNFARRSKVGRIWWDQWGLYQSAQATGHRWLFLPKGFCSFAARPRLQIAAFVHDIMGDFYQRHYPGFESKLESFYFAHSLAATLRQSRVIFTNTEFSKRELTGWAQRTGLSCPKLIVAGYGFVPPQPDWTEKENRILLFASAMPHKRTDIAMRFLTRWLRESKYDGVVDCIGIFSSRMARPEGRGWRWIGRVLPAESRKMMRGARAVVYVSEYEGFGMPPVEAVLEGSCPVFSDIPPLREAMGETGCPFSNDSEESFLKAMDRAMTTSTETIQSWAAGLLHRHHWPAVAERIVHALPTT